MRCLVRVAVVLATLAGLPDGGRAAPAHAKPLPPGQQMVTATGEGASPEAARAAALRAAVARVVQRLVPEKLRAERAQAVEGVLARAAGFVVLKGAGTAGRKDAAHTFAGEFVLATVPLALALREEGLLPDRRVMVALTESFVTRPVPSPAVEAELIRQLVQAGFRVVKAGRPATTMTEAELLEAAREADADLLVTGKAWAESGKLTMPAGLKSASGFSSARAHLEVQAFQVGTGDVVATLSGHASAAAPGQQATAARMALGQAARRLAPELIADLLLLPVVPTRRVRLEVSGLKSFTDATALEGVLAALPAVVKLARASYENGKLVLNVDLAAGAASDWAAELENPEATRPFTLTIDQVEYGRIHASLK